MLLLPKVPVKVNAFACGTASAAEQIAIKLQIIKEWRGGYRKFKRLQMVSRGMALQRMFSQPGDRGKRNYRKSEKFLGEESW